MSRASDLDRFYDLLDRLEANVGGKRRLAECTGRMDWPERGVYFFFASGGTREATDQLRVTRVGTHAVSTGSGTSLWTRLRAHRGANRGSYEGGGNHRGSVFRRHVGRAMIERDELGDEYPRWGEGSTADRERRLAELAHERRVSEYIRDLPFLWVHIGDEPGPESDRAYVERNAIALVSNFERDSVDPRSDEWLGRESPRNEITDSGLWNIAHVDERHEAGFLDRLADAVDGTSGL
jgi:hypothetical protein